MTSIDKAAIGWTIAIVAVAAGIAGVSLQSSDIDSTSAPESTVTMGDVTITKSAMFGMERTTSMLDPGIGHESHQIAILLAPSDKVYSGTLKYDASEPIHLVTLHGPLAEGEDNGQPIWTPDGETKFALTFVDQESAKGEWMFAGNALAVHTMFTNPFIVDYDIDYTEKRMSDTVMTGTLDSMTDPGVGHASHQLTVILPPSANTYSGIVSYSASEPIQLVSLRGPLAEGETADPIWTPDGETVFALTFVDAKNSMGSWEFSGNALAVHTMKSSPMTTSFSVSATESEAMMEEPEEAMMEEPEEAMSAGPTTVTVVLPAGTSVPGCEETDACFTPASVSISAGDTVSWDNTDTAAHTVTSGAPADGPDGVFDSSLLMGGSSFEVTFDDSGSYDYFCMVHPWMVGNVTVG